MRSTSLPVGMLVLGCLLSGPAIGDAPARETPRELTRLQVLMVFDTLDPDLAPSLKIDEERLTAFLSETIPAARYHTTVLRGKEVTAAKILEHYRNLKVAPDEGLVFLYGGHGAIDSDRGHYFDLGGRKRLLRSELREAMQAKKAGLVLILSDCCSTPKKLREPKVRKKGVLATPREIEPTVRQLFFLSRGVVDVTAATDNASWSDNEQGGLFTRALCEMLTRDPKDLDVNRDGKLTWNEVFPQLRDRTLQVFTGWRKELTGRGERIPARTQKPSAFFLGEKTVFAVVGIENATRDPITYQFRWTDLQERAERITLQPGEKKVHYMAVGDSGGVMPPCEAQFPGISEAKALKVKRWEGTIEPTYANGIKYRLRSKE